MTHEHHYEINRSENPEHLINAALSQIGKKSLHDRACNRAIFFLGMSAAFLGNVVEKDIHKSSLIATITFALGMAGTGLDWKEEPA